MRLHVKELRALAASYGCRIQIRYRPIIWNRYESGKPNFGEVRGFYSGNFKYISVVVYGRPAKRKILGVLAHEVRHAEHDFLGLFKDYYRKDLYLAYQACFNPSMVLPKSFKKPNNKIAFLAENDCNKWADKFLISKGIKPLKDKYPFVDTFAYHINSRLKEKGL